MTVAPACAYDRRDWSSAFVNVEQELTNAPLTAVLGNLPPELSGTMKSLNATG